MNTGFQLWPDEASGMAHSVDQLFLFLLLVTAFFTLLIAGLIITFVLRYRRRKADDVGAAMGSPIAVEITWTVIPLAIAMVMFVWGARLYIRMAQPPADATTVYVIGKQWMWKVQHASGRREINELHVPMGVPIRLVMTSQDVIHSFFMPAFRIKQDVVPGRYSSQWFTATKLGESHLFCSEYCGTQHSHMVGRVVVMEPAEYERWLANVPADESAAVRGGKLFTQYGCNSCHGLQAPTLAGLYGSRVQLEDGTSVVADDAYLRESILDSQAKVVAGFGHVMPSYRGQVTEEQILDLLAYIRSLKPADKKESPR